MKHSDILIGAFLIVLLAACVGQYNASTPTPGLLPAGMLGTPTGEKVLYSFQGGTDGRNPESSLVDVGNTLYGATEFGGQTYCKNASPGCGTIFKIDTTGAGYAVLHRYAKNGKGGADPIPGVIHASGMLYGTTEWGGGLGCGGVGGCGTVFKMDRPGKTYRVLHSFNGTALSDGVIAGLLDVNGTLYGATAGTYNGTCFHGCGTLFKVDGNSGKESTLHDFGQQGADGNKPIFGLIDVGGTLYGATTLGGDLTCNQSSAPFGCGTIFKINTSGAGFRVLYRFTGGQDGAFPNNVIAVGGSLYGTTVGGGAACGCGTVFKLDLASDTESVLYRFKGGDDGISPNGLLADVNGTLYSTTTFGGGTNCTNLSGTGCGIVFGINTSGTGYHVLHRFQGGNDGANPLLNGVVVVNGALYGTTFYGGGSGCGGSGCGTVFSIAP